MLWWHVWTGHPTSTLTCACGDPAQEVWFVAWPAWALWHAANPFFSSAVNVPYGANLLSNTSGTLIGLVLSPITRIWGPVAATNVALTLAPGLSAWGCWVAVRRVVTWKTAAIPAALVYGYSPAIVTSVMFGHASVALLVVPPLLFVHLFEMFARPQKSALHDGLVLFALVVVQFWISPEVLVICALFAVLALLAVVAAVVLARSATRPTGSCAEWPRSPVARHRRRAVDRRAGLSGLVRTGGSAGGLRAALPVRPDRRGGPVAVLLHRGGTAALHNHRARDRLSRAQRSAGELHGVG